MTSINDNEETSLRGRVGGTFVREARIDEVGYPDVWGDTSRTDALGKLLDLSRCPRMRERRIDQRHAIETVGVSMES